LPILLLNFTVAGFTGFNRPSVHKIIKGNMPEERPQEQDSAPEPANSPAAEQPAAAVPPESKPPEPPAVTAEVVAEPAKPVTPKPATPPAPDNSVLIGERLQQFWQQVGPVVLVSGISVLRVLVSLLTNGLTLLEKKAPDQASTAPTVTGLLEKADPVVQKAKPFLAQLWQLWLKLLVWLRSVAPANWQRQLNSLTDNVLTAIMVGILLLVFWFWGLITPDQPPATRKVANRPPEVSRSARPKVTPAPQVASKPVRTAPSIAPSSAPSVAPSIAATPRPIPKPKPSPAAIPSPKPSPAAAPSSSPIAAAAKPTTEQTRLADLRTKFSKVANAYSDGLVQDVTLNPTTSRLRVQLKDKWYDLNASQQDQLAQGLLDSSASADFSKLELADTKNRLVARSPVVGSDVVILRRSLS
jgi:hypothetical protein